MIADWSSENPEIGKLLDQLQGSKQIPLTVIFPAGMPEQAIRFGTKNTSGLKGKLIKALREAGPSKNKPMESSRETVANQTEPVIMTSRLP